MGGERFNSPRRRTLSVTFTNLLSCLFFHFPPLFSFVPVFFLYCSIFMWGIPPTGTLPIFTYCPAAVLFPSSQLSQPWLACRGLSGFSTDLMRLIYENALLNETFNLQTNDFNVKNLLLWTLISLELFCNSLIAQKRSAALLIKLKQLTEWKLIFAGLHHL